MVLKLKYLSHLEIFLNYSLLGSTSRSLESVGLTWSLGNSIKFPGDAEMLVTMRNYKGPFMLRLSSQRSHHWGFLAAL